MHYSVMMEVAKSQKPILSNRILLDIPCKVCQDHSSGKHYGIFACDGCAGFFKRSIRRNRQYICKAKSPEFCLVDKTHRNQCRACRLKKCVNAGMNREAVQHERGPRNSTIRKQMSLFMHESETPQRIPGTTTNKTVSIASEEAKDFVSRPAGFFIPYAAPVIVPQMVIESLCESAARLLFINVKWAKSIPVFTGLPFRDQLLLLEEGWRELFILSTAQFMIPLEMGSLLYALGQSEVESTNKVLHLMSEVRLFHDMVNKFRQMQVDPTEYACLRAIVLFKTVFASGSAEIRGLTDATAVSILQDQAQLTLNKYIGTAYPTQPFRFGKLLLSLPTLQSVSSATIKDLFFKKTIGSMSIDRLLCDMYKSNDL